MADSSAGDGDFSSEPDPSLAANSSAPELDATDDNADAPHVVIITGLSGSGKSTAVHALEDLGFFCIDNLPVPLLDEALRLASTGDGGVQSLGFVIDTRGRMFLDDAEYAIRQLRGGDIRLQVIFLEADDDTIVQRFSETRRRHPMSKGDEENGTLREAIGQERARLTELRALADAVVDTSDLTVHELADFVQERFAGEKTSSFNVTLLSFGYKHGLPAECDLVFDVRFLDNPYYDDELRELDGRDKAVREYVFDDPDADRFLSHVEELADFILPLYEGEGKTYLTIGIGCTGGNHRSVAISEELAGRLSDQDWDVQTRHRDVGR